MDVFIMWNTHNTQAQIGPGKHPNHTWCICCCSFLSDAQFLLEQSIAKAVTKGLLLKKKVKVPKIEVVFVNIKDIVEGEEIFLAEMKANMLQEIQVSFGHWS